MLLIAPCESTYNTVQCLLSLPTRFDVKEKEADIVRAKTDFSNAELINIDSLLFNPFFVS